MDGVVATCEAEGAESAPHRLQVKLGGDALNHHRCSPLSHKQRTMLSRAATS
eukprot:CAMPEP_0176293916 /NCGR_PEP_ID=MMETSP0121_2-20121125/56862_1 /TAXON_ID=160619 /ORGANISM="Kryptoperidinium foliaceum, Strain CCMP 1326" /LENGTH=51 /DNA_ID=CAMNT_0017634907 /DNA_START=404 /DNA_END=556 /DNA_ORIENTATION=+